jgi:hypothetical protein
VARRGPGSGEDWPLPRAIKRKVRFSLAYVLSSYANGAISLWVCCRFKKVKIMLAIARQNVRYYLCVPIVHNPRILPTVSR